MELLQKQKLDAIGSLASGISHEFNNLLQTIRAYTHFALESLPPTSPAYKDLQHVLHAAEHGGLLTRQLLDFSRPQEIRTQPCQIDEVIQYLSSMLEPLLPQEISFQLQLHSEDAFVSVDKQRIHHALLNLCLNARDAMREQGGLLQIKSQCLSITAKDLLTTPQTSTDTFADIYKPQLPYGDYVLLTVSDTGTGIPADVQSHIFEPFYTTKEVGKGTGLGLAVTYGAIQQIGGHVTFRSELDQGTNFYIYLPLCQSSPGSTREMTKAMESLTQRQH